MTAAMSALSLRSPARRVPLFVPLALLVVLAVPCRGQAPPAREGRVSVFLALDGGVQNLIGGALVSGVDVLSQASRMVGTVSVGVRAETSFGLVAGFDVGMGVARGNLHLVDPSGPLEVTYRNRTQRHWNVMVGHALGDDRRTTVHLYLSEVSRSFDVDVDEAGARYSQRDGQGLLRFGLGVEREVTDAAALRVRVGTSQADFGGRPTNITPTRPVDVMIGAVLSPPRKR